MNPPGARDRLRPASPTPPGILSCLAGLPVIPTVAELAGAMNLPADVVTGLVVQLECRSLVET